MSGRDPAGGRYQAALGFLFQRIDYERSLAVPYRSGGFKLDRMRELLARLDRPDRGFAIVHIAGTKGKGSTAALIAAAMTAAGHRSGLFTSPHLDRVEERMAVDGLPCPSDRFAELVEEIAPVVREMDASAAAIGENGPTYFEITTAMALVHFRQSRVAIAVLEVGLGGRLDSTNVCRPQVSVITSISFDHTKQLGSTLQAIAAEKAGIIKPGVPVISGVSADEARPVIVEACRAHGSRLIEIDRDFSFQWHPPRRLDLTPAHGFIDYEEPESGIAWRNVELGLLGRHQGANAAVALTALLELRRLGWSVPEDVIRRGFRELAWPARIEVVARRPTVIIDAAHNVASVAALVETLSESFQSQRRILIFATTLEKDLRGMLQLLLPAFDHVLLTRYLDNPRAVPLEELAAIAEEVGGHGYPRFETPAAAWRAARDIAQPADVICVTGSFFIAAQLRHEIQMHPAGYSQDS